MRRGLWPTVGGCAEGCLKGCGERVCGGHDRGDGWGVYRDGAEGHNEGVPRGVNRLGTKRIPFLPPTPPFTPPERGVTVYPPHFPPSHPPLLVC
jgi:hypothetical protein